jgi:hypothetical protein
MKNGLPSGSEMVPPRRLHVTLSLFGRAKAKRLAPLATIARDQVEELLHGQFFERAPFSSISIIVRLGPGFSTNVQSCGTRKHILDVLIEAPIDDVKAADDNWVTSFFLGLLILGCLSVGEAHGLNTHELEVYATRFREEHS